MASDEAVKAPDFSHFAQALCIDAADHGSSIVVGILQGGVLQTFRVGHDRDCMKLASVLLSNENAIKEAVGQ